MKKNNLTFENLRDSELLYKKDLPVFGYFFLLLILVLICVLSIWGIRTTKPYIVRGIGTVESPNKNYVMTSFTGEVSGFSIKEGDHVNKGEVLFTVNSTDSKVQNKQIENQKKVNERRIRNYKKLVRSIKDDKNYFNSANDEENMFYSRYEEYKSQIRQQIVDINELKSYGYTKEQIDEEIRKNDNKKLEIYYSTIREVDTSREQIQTELNMLNAQEDALHAGADDYIVKANATGKIHMLGDYKDGMVIQAASPVASISGDNDRVYINATISASDRSRIKKGNKVDIEIEGLQKNIYGSLKGKIIAIDTDVSKTEDGKVFFKIKIEPEKNYLKNKGGNKIELSTGMQAKVSITYEEITYAKYLLDAIGLK